MVCELWPIGIPNQRILEKGAKQFAQIMNFYQSSNKISNCSVVSEICFCWECLFKKKSLFKLCSPGKKPSCTLLRPWLASKVPHFRSKKDLHFKFDSDFSIFVSRT